MNEMLTTRQLAKRATAFCAIERVHDLIRLLDEPDHLFMVLLATQQYHTFTVPKKDGSERLIEHPETHLKRVQTKLNDYLQAVYYLNKTEAAYGFLVVPDDERYPRHIVSNAQAHLGKPWLLNIDLEDFFHQVRDTMVRAIFLAPPFKFSNDVADALARLACYKGRLPMGAPTSPVLSNFAVVNLDQEVDGLCRENGWTFTRIRAKQIGLLEEIVNRHSFTFNPKKIKVFPPEAANVVSGDFGRYDAFVYDPGTKKVITGIQLGEHGVELPERFIEKLNGEIDRLRQITVVHRHLWHQPTEWVEQYQRQIKGMVGFAEQVLGRHHGTYRALRASYVQALEPPDPFEGVSWLDFPYFTS
jgi:RNA-directed DNA polymerase